MATMPILRIIDTRTVPAALGTLQSLGIRRRARNVRAVADPIIGETVVIRSLTGNESEIRERFSVSGSRSMASSQADGRRTPGRKAVGQVQSMASNTRRGNIPTITNRWKRPSVAHVPA